MDKWNVYGADDVVIVNGVAAVNVTTVFTLVIGAVHIAVVFILNGAATDYAPSV